MGSPLKKKVAFPAEKTLDGLVLAVLLESISGPQLFVKLKAAFGAGRVDRALERLECVYGWSIDHEAVDLDSFGYRLDQSEIDPIVLTDVGDFLTIVKPEFSQFFE